MIRIDRMRLEGIIEFMGDEFTTVDVIREYLGHYHRDEGTSPWHSFNAQFGRYLATHRAELRIEKDRTIPVRDDGGGKTRAMCWRKLRQ